MTSALYQPDATQGNTTKHGRIYDGAEECQKTTGTRVFLKIWERTFVNDKSIKAAAEEKEEQEELKRAHTDRLLILHYQCLSPRPI